MSTSPMINNNHLPTMTNSNVFPPSTTTSSQQLDECNVFVKYLPSDLTEEQFYDLFKEFGEIVSSKIMVDQNTGKSLGFGFVRFNDSESSQKAITKMNGLNLHNKRLLCKLANQSQHNSDHLNNILGHQTPSNNLYIKPLLPNTTEDDLRKLFEPFGTIVECKVMIDRQTGLSRQIGFVRFETVEHAKKALEKMSNYKLDDTSLPLTVKYEDTPEQKKARRSIRTQVTGPRGIPVVPIVYYPSSPTWYGGISYPPYPGYEYGIPFSPPNYYGPPPFPMTPPSHGEPITPGSPVFHPFSWNPNDYHPSHYGPGTGYPNNYSFSNYDDINDEDSISDETIPKEDDSKEDNTTPFPMFDEVSNGNNNGNGKNRIEKDSKKQNGKDKEKEKDSKPYKNHSTTKPINIRRQDDSKD